MQPQVHTLAVMESDLPGPSPGASGSGPGLRVVTGSSDQSVAVVELQAQPEEGEAGEDRVGAMGRHEDRVLCVVAAGEPQSPLAAWHRH